MRPSFEYFFPPDLLGAALYTHTHTHTLLFCQFTLKRPTRPPHVPGTAMYELTWEESITFPQNMCTSSETWWSPLIILYYKSLLFFPKSDYMFHSRDLTAHDSKLFQHNFWWSEKKA